MLARTPLRWQHIPRIVAALLATLIISATPALAQPGSHYFSLEVDADTCGCTYDVTVWGWTDANATITTTYSLNVTSNGVTTPVTYTFMATADANGYVNETVPGLNIPGGCTNSTVTITITAFNVSGDSTNTTQLFPQPVNYVCAFVPPPGKTFSIGPSSMEGNINMRPGDWVSGGYDFTFPGSHIATTVTVTATVTVPFRCANGTTGQFVVNLGTDSYNVSANNNQWIPTGDQNSILSWDGAVQAPAGCGAGNVMNNSTGAIFTATVSQNPATGDLINWRFKYRDPNAKGGTKGNVNCTDSTDPRRNDAATCGASWSQTVKDP